MDELVSTYFSPLPQSVEDCTGGCSFYAECIPHGFVSEVIVTCGGDAEKALEHLVGLVRKGEGSKLIRMSIRILTIILMPTKATDDGGSNNVC